MPLDDTVLPKASYFFVAVTLCDEFDCSVAFLSPECWKVEVEPWREETPGVYFFVPSSSTLDVTPIPARRNVREPFVPLVETRAPRPLWS